MLGKVTNMKQMCFMVELLTYKANAAEFANEDQLLYDCGVPKWAERYIDWSYLKARADFNSSSSIY